MNALVRNIFYPLKAAIPRSLQISIRQRVLRHRLPRFSHIWPIHEGAGKIPAGWQGWPGGKEFALILTHDVENCDGQEKVRHLMELEKGLGFRSSFNFVPKRYRVCADLRRSLVEEGFEVGVHGLYHDGMYYQSRQIFRRRAMRINSFLKNWGAVGFRSPSMHSNLDWIHELQIEYDASTFDTDPFEPQPHGVGTIFPFYVRGGSGGKGYVELPYTLPQDFTLFVLMRERNIEIWKRKLDWIAAKGGMALLNTHPDYMNFGGHKMHREEYPSHFYEDFLKYIRNRYAGRYLHLLPKEMAGHWKENCRHLPSPGQNKVGQTAAAQFRNAGRRSLNICMLSYSFYNMDARVSRYAEALVRRGDRVDILSLGHDGEGSFSLVNGVNVFKIQKRERNERGKFSYLFRLLRFFFTSSVFLSKKHLRRAYDVVHVHSVPDFEVFAAWLPKLAGTKIILDIHDLVPEFYAAKFSQKKDSLLYKLLLKIEKISGAFANHVIISNHLWEKTISRSVKETKRSAILNYPDQAIFYPRPRKGVDDKFVMIYPGTLNWHQGLDIAIRAFSRIADQIPEAEFHIYGEGRARNRLAELIEELSLGDRVFLHDPLPKEKIAEVMAGAGLGVVPKRNDSFGGEAFSTKILEFMALGVPVIVSATKIDRYYFNPSVVRFFQPENEADLARGMVSLAKDEALRQSLAAHASEFLEGYTWENNKHLYLDLVDSLAKK